jgi:transposase
MDRQTLAAMSQEQLIELVLALVAEVAELRARLGEPPKTSANSSTPPSAEFKPNRAERRARKRGPKRGHLGTSRLRQAPDVVVDCRPETCRGCQAPLPTTSQRCVGRSQVIELPPLRPVVIEARRYAALCGRCGTRTKGTYPAGLEPTRTFGPGIETLVGYFHTRHHVGYERLVEICRDVFGLAISEGGIDHALTRLAAQLQPTYAALGATVRASPVIGSDETSARIDGRTGWHWVFQSATASYHVITARRNGDVVAAFLADAQPEVWVSDCWAPQLKAPAAAHQLCLAHQIRDLTYAVEADGYAGRVWAIELRHLLGRAIALSTQRGALDAAAFARRRLRIENAVDRLLDVYLLPDDATTLHARRLRARYREHRASLFVFLDRADVPPTNNASEQDLRPAVIHRKVTGGYRSQAGADRAAIVTSVLATARKLGHNLLDALRAPASPSPLQAADLAT